MRVEVVFSGLDRGYQGGVEHAYERSLPVADALRDDVLLAYAVNGEPLPPQHGFPLRVIVPGWYGMTHVKWLAGISVVDEPFRGWQQEEAYRFHVSENDPGTPVTRMLPRALLAPPGIPDFLTRSRFLDAGPCTIAGRAWSGWGAVERVEVSVDGGERWADAVLDEPLAEFAWRGWTPRLGLDPGRIHALLPRHRRRGQRAADRGRVEPRRVLQQRGAARARHRRLTRRGRPAGRPRIHWLSGERALMSGAFQGGPVWLAAGSAALRSAQCSPSRRRVLRPPAHTPTRAAGRRGTSAR